MITRLVRTSTRTDARLEIFIWDRLLSGPLTGIAISLRWQKYDKLIRGFQNDFSDSVEIFVFVLAKMLQIHRGTRSLESLAYVCTTYPAIKNVANEAIQSIKSLSYSLPRAIQGTLADTVEFDGMKKRYVEREAVKRQISSIIERKEADGTYYVIYGSRGVGKSTVLDSAISGHYGILKIALTRNDGPEFIMRQLTKITGSTNLNPSFDDFKAALRAGKSMLGTIPTIIFEVASGNGPEQVSGIEVIGNFAKSLATVCSCIIVISEVSAVLEFGKFDPFLQFLFIEELTYDQAIEYVKKTQINLTDAEIMKVIDNIGANPAILNRLKAWVMNGLTVDGFITDTFVNVRLQLGAFQHQRILKALKDHPEGVNPLCFKKPRNKGIDLSIPGEACKAMKKAYAIVYRVDLQMYKTVSRAHEVAMRTYDPVVPKKTCWHFFLNK